MAGTKKCPYCGEFFDSGLSYCPYCGATYSEEAAKQTYTQRVIQEQSEKSDKSVKNGKKIFILLAVIAVCCLIYFLCATDNESDKSAEPTVRHTVTEEQKVVHNAVTVKTDKKQPRVSVAQKKIKRIDKSRKTTKSVVVPRVNKNKVTSSKPNTNSVVKSSASNSEHNAAREAAKKRREENLRRIQNEY